ncbi:MAG TPA: HD domain-containing protein [Deltaproteobacteria bacterium]|nr:HD domain-containing protein [Deltaproteobacteria bacterium]
MNLKKTFIRDLSEGGGVEGLFLVTKKETSMSRTGRPYLSLRLRDRTGEVEARVWDDAERIGRAFAKDDVVAVKGHAATFRGEIQLNLTDVRAVGREDYSLRDFLPSSRRDPAEMIAELDAVVEGLKDPHIKGLLKALLADDDVRRRLMTAPAAKSMHHAYLGGLIEHILSLCGLARLAADHYGDVNGDMLIAGAVLHDIGKIYELSYERSFDYTDEGRLIGHITIGVELVDEKLRLLPGFPRETAMQLKHMILSHHGLLEYGSPKRPKSLEALILSFIDDLDAKVQAFRAAVDSGGADERWTPYQRIFERYLYKAPAAPSDEREPAETETARGGKRTAGGAPDDTPAEKRAADPAAVKEDKELELF